MKYDEFMNTQPAFFNIWLDEKIENEKRQFYQDNNRFGMVCATLANIFGKKTYKASDFFKCADKEKAQTNEEMIEILKMLAEVDYGE